MKQNKCIIGITGNIASGKSIVSKYLIKKGYQVIDADEISRKSLNVGTKGYYGVIEFFGEKIVSKDKSINRKILGEIIFSNEEKRVVLNSILHPIIEEEMLKKIVCSEHKIVFVDIPLLFENMERFNKIGIKFDEIWLVYSEYNIQLRRLMKRDNIDENSAIKKIESQMKASKKKLLTDKILYNNDSIEQLLKHVDYFIDSINDCKEV